MGDGDVSAAAYRAERRRPERFARRAVRYGGMALISVTALTPLVLADGIDMHGDFGTGWWIAMMLGMLLFWGLVIAAIVWVVRELSSHQAARADRESPTALLDRRFAAGEISASEYRERKAVLAGTDEGSNPTTT
jgi:putative membrane protein